MQVDRNGLEVLDRDQCIALLASTPVARVGLSMQALPVILPVNFVIDGDDIIIRTTAGSKADAALHRAVVAIEADHYDPMDHTGWSVLVRGQTRMVGDPVDIERLRGLWLEAWAVPDGDRWLAIPMEIVTGRRILHDRAVAASAPASLDAGSFDTTDHAARRAQLRDHELDLWPEGVTDGGARQPVGSTASDIDRSASQEDP